jgi:hypothetical protein
MHRKVKKCEINNKCNNVNKYQTLYRCNHYTNVIKINNIIIQVFKYMSELYTCIYIIQTKLTLLLLSYE